MLIPNKTDYAVYNLYGSENPLDDRLKRTSSSSYGTTLDGWIPQRESDVGANGW